MLVEEVPSFVAGEDGQDTYRYFRISQVTKGKGYFGSRQLFMRKQW